MSDLKSYARALSVLESHLARRRDGVAETSEQLLAQHPDLRDVLEPMLDEIQNEEPSPSPASTTETPWRGLPGPGDLVGGYRIEDLLGQGGMGVVFVATDERLDRKVALKLVRPERLGSHAARERFWREAKLAARLEHPNICPVYQVDEERGVPFMAMRLLHGETLTARIAREQASASTETGESARRRIDAHLLLVEQVARALHFAHEHGVVHRDVKPGNVLIESDGTPIVLDFGMATTHEDADLGLTMTGELAGTPLYTSPEQVKGKGHHVDRRADVFSLGVTLYEAITGVRPFAGPSMRELLDAVLQRDPPPPSRHQPQVPRDLDVVVGKAIDKDPDYRYRTALDFADDLDRVRRHLPVAARPAGPWLRTRRWVQRNPVAVGFLALIVAALVVITIFFVSAETARRDFALVSLARRMQELRERQRDLYAHWPDHTPALRDWLSRADALRADIGAARAVVERLAVPGEKGPMPPADPAERFLYDTLRVEIADVDALFGEHGFAPRVRRNLDWEVGQRPLVENASSAAWREAIDAIARNDRYGGLRITPQVGLVPIGADPTSRLWEFGHPRSGTIPIRAADGGLPIADDTGMVFVLLPGATFTMGAQSKEQSAPNFDPHAAAEEGPPREVTLAPFFIGKYEMTQAQWMRLGDGRNPSYFDPKQKWSIKLSLMHPVESVTWFECVELLAESGLVLPTEAQWEYACRGGESTPWWTGEDKASLLGKVNLADRASKRVGLTFYHFDPELDDGFPVTAPVDTLAANGFGLFHVAGNVLEWCRDAYGSYAIDPAEGDGLRKGPDDAQRVIRSAAFDSPSDYARSAKRREDDPASRDKGMGLRAARALR